MEILIETMTQVQRDGWKVRVWAPEGTGELDDMSGWIWHNMFTKTAKDLAVDILRIFRANAVEVTNSVGQGFVARGIK